MCALGSTTASPQGKRKIVKTKPDFTGTWLLDRTKSNVGSSSRPDQPLKIVHRDPELRITHRSENNGQVNALDLVYYTDARGETNPTTMFLSTGTDMNQQGHDKDVTKSKTGWSGNKLVTRSTLRNVIAGRFLEFEIVDEWRLSDDGKTLTQTSRTIFRQDNSSAIVVPARRPDFKRVYNRVPD
jgi:hypothetical protein